MLLIGYIFCLPASLFNDPVSTVLLDRNGQLLGARIAADGQWRFPPADTVPEKFARALITFEDKRFYKHPGVDPLAMGRAIRLNIDAGEVVSGGSTLTMQVIRMSRKGKPRNVWQKVIEMILATRLELRKSKEDILKLYASHAPFGGNVVGLDAAAWKYFGREAVTLSWAEAATLAVLPNAPGLIHPGKNRQILLEKRNRLLDKLLESGMMDSTTHFLALQESLPEKPLPIPSYAPHLLDKVDQEGYSLTGSKLIRSTIDMGRQVRMNDIVERHYHHLSQNGVHNAAVIVLEVETGDVVAYVGNTPGQAAEHGCSVDIIQSRRSTGSILKPFLFASMLNDGELLPGMLIPDVPSYYDNFNPTNYDRTYSGAVPARRALSRSLNIPAVRLLQEHGIAKFQAVMQQWGLTTFDRPADDYGLTLILGGGEATLWELGGVYASLSRTLADFQYYNGEYDPVSFRPPNYLAENSRGRIPEGSFSILTRENKVSAAAVWHTFEAMVAVTRPANESFWENFASSDRIAWKTGTSYGNRDAWSIGCTPDYVVGVWVGNADGEGRPGLTGATAAAPLMFDVFNAIGNSGRWFQPPLDEMIQVPVCRQSGYRVQEYCEEADTLWVPLSGQRTPPCPFHRLVHLDESRTWQVNSECESPSQMVHASWFVLPPVQENYYKSGNPDYRILPDFRADCREKDPTVSMYLIYPRPDAQIYLPVELDGTNGSVVFEAVHRNRDTKIFWHLDENFAGETREIHQMAFQPVPGRHILTLVDEKGETLKAEFEVLEKDRTDIP